MKHHPRIWERPMLLLLFLFGLGAWNRAWVFFLLLAALSLALWGLRTDFSRSEVLLLFFSLFYALADTYYSGLSLRAAPCTFWGPGSFTGWGKPMLCTPAAAVAFASYWPLRLWECGSTAF